MSKNFIMWLIVFFISLTAGFNQGEIVFMDENDSINYTDKSEKEWEKELTEEEFRVLRKCGTEPAFTGKYYDFYENGKYVCAACDYELFDSDTKYASGSGWPSFYDVAEKGNVILKQDTSLGMIRTEISCAQCGGHLGHVFPDGPNPTGLRYCVNSVSLKFVKDK